MADEIASQNDKSNSTNTPVQALKKPSTICGKSPPAEISTRQSARLKSPVDLYVAVPARSPADYSNRKSSWAENAKLLELRNDTIASLMRANFQYSKALLESPTEMTRLNEALCFQGDTTAVAFSGPSSLSKSFDEILRGTTAGTRQKLEEVENLLGLSKGHNQTDADRSSKLAAGMRKLFDYHFEVSHGTNLEKRSKTMGNIILSEDFLGKDIGMKIATKLAASVSRAVHTPQAITNAIDLYHDSLNDRALSELARVQVNENLYLFTRGH